MYTKPSVTTSISYKKITTTYFPEVTKNTHYLKHSFSVSRRQSSSRLFLQHTNDGSIWEEELSISNFIAYEKNAKSIENDLKIFVRAFQNQRKMYKYAIAWNKYQNDIISDEEMDKLEELLAVHIDNNCSIDEVNTNILSLFKYIKEDNFDFEELSTILAVPRKYIAELSSQIKSS